MLVYDTRQCQYIVTAEVRCFSHLARQWHERLKRASVRCGTWDRLRWFGHGGWEGC